MTRLALAGTNHFIESCSNLVSRLGAMLPSAIVCPDTAMAAKCGIELHTPNLDQLLANHADAFDAVLMDATCDIQALQAGLDAGKHILYCGHLSAEQSELAAVESQVEQSSQCLMLGTADRFRPSLQTVRHSITSGQIGEPGLLRIHRWESPNQASQSLDVATHHEIDVACWLFGTQPELVFAAATPNAVGDRPCYQQLHLGFPGDGMALIDINLNLPTGDDYFSLSMIGSKGAAYADDHHNMQLRYAGGAPTAERTSEANFAKLAQLQEFLTAIGEQRPPVTNVSNWNRVQAIVDAVEQSQSSGQAVTLDS